MNNHFNRGFVTLVFILITVLATTAVTGAGYGIYKYQQATKENKDLKNEVASQKDQKIKELQEEVGLLKTEITENPQASTTKEKTFANTDKDTSSVIAETKYKKNLAREKALAQQQKYEAETKTRQIEDAAEAEKLRKNNEAEEALLLVETCKAQRDAKKTKLWNAMLVAVKLAEQQNEQEKFNLLVDTIPSGSMPATAIVKLAKTSPEEHEENLSIAEKQMESTLAEFYRGCIQGE